MGPVIVLAKFEVRIALPVLENIAIGVLSGVGTPFLEKGRPYGVGMVPFERAKVSSYIGLT